MAERSAANFTSLERLGWTAASFAALLLIWHLASVVAADPVVMPSPVAVFATIKSLALSGALWPNISVTLQRLVLAFAFAMTAGCVIGILLGFFKTADKFFDPWVTLFLNLPAIIVITLCLIWGGMNETSIVIAAALNKIPSTAVTMREGTRGLSRDFAEMAEIYKFGWWKTLRHVTLPQLTPFFATAGRTGLALIWKILLVVEAFAGKGRGVGVQIMNALHDFDVAAILAYTMSFIVILLVVESVLLQPLWAKAGKWRR